MHACLDTSVFGSRYRVHVSVRAFKNQETPKCPERLKTPRGAFQHREAVPALDSLDLVREDLSQLLRGVACVCCCVGRVYYFVNCLGSEKKAADRVWPKFLKFFLAEKPRSTLCVPVTRLCALKARDPGGP